MITAKNNKHSSQIKESSSELSKHHQQINNNINNDNQSDVFDVSENLVSKIKHSMETGGCHSIEEINAMLDEAIANQ